MTSKLKQFLENQYSSHVVKQVKHYQKVYGFDMPNGSTHNNEADAFKHTFMQAELAIYGTQDIAKRLGDMHEQDGNIRNSQPKGEEIMDQHNNAQGREIATEILQKFGPIVRDARYSKWVYDYIAKSVYERMKQGRIILDPSGRTKLKPRPANIQSSPRQTWDRHGNVTGYAANVTDDEKQDIINKYKDSDSFSGMSDEEIWDRYVDFEEQKFFNPKNRVFYENEFNPALAPRGSNERIFGRATGAKAS